MPFFTIDSRKLGERQFYASDWGPYGGYVSIKEGGRWVQICEGGGYRGWAVPCDGTAAGLARAARRWHRQNLRAMRQMEY